MAHVNRTMKYSYCNVVSKNNYGKKHGSKKAAQAKAARKAMKYNKLDY